MWGEQGRGRKREGRKIEMGGRGEGGRDGGAEIRQGNEYET